MFLAAVTSSNTQAPTTEAPPSPELLDRCAPAENFCSPEVRFGFAHDCRYYYECASVTSEQHYVVRQCDAGYAYDVTTRECVAEADAACENSCPGFVLIIAPPDTTGEDGITDVILTRRPTPGLISLLPVTTNATTSTTLPDEIDTVTLVSDEDSVTSFDLLPSDTSASDVTTTSLDYEIQTSAPPPSTTTTTPNILDLTIDSCAPPQEECVPGLTFGYAADCTRYYRCIDPDANNGRYYQTLACWSFGSGAEDGYDVTTGSCQPQGEVTCETSCPGYIRTTVAPPETTTTTRDDVTVVMTSPSDGIDSNTTDSPLTPGNQNR